MMGWGGRPRAARRQFSPRGCGQEGNLRRLGGLGDLHDAHCAGRENRSRGGTDSRGGQDMPQPAGRRRRPS